MRRRDVNASDEHRRSLDLDDCQDRHFVAERTTAHHDQAIDAYDGPGLDDNQRCRRMLAERHRGNLGRVHQPRRGKHRLVDDRK